MKKCMLSDYIEKTLHAAKKYKKMITIIFLANVKDKTDNYKDYKSTSITTEFLSMNEYEEIIQSLQSFGFYTITYFNTDDFILDYLKGVFSHDILIVFEGTQRGTGRAKDSFIPAFCDLQGIMHTGPNAYVNSICTNKYHWTKILECHNIVVPKSWCYDGSRWINNDQPPVGMNLITKPIHECASIGIYKESVSKFNEKYFLFIKNISHDYSQPVIVQEHIEGYEAEVPVIIGNGKKYAFSSVLLHNEKTTCIGKEILDFTEIYDDKYNLTILREIQPIWDNELKKITQKIVNILGIDSYSRIDFRINTQGIPYVTDINSYPHIVKHSSYACAFSDAGIDPTYIVPCIIGNCILNNQTIFEVL